MIKGVVDLQPIQVFTQVDVGVIASNMRWFGDKRVLVDFLAISLSPKDKRLVVLQSESDKRERSISTLGFEVVGNEGEGEERIHVCFDPGTSWVEVVIR